MITAEGKRARRTLNDEQPGPVGLSEWRGRCVDVVQCTLTSVQPYHNLFRGLCLGGWEKPVLALVDFVHSQADGVPKEKLAGLIRII